MSKLSKLAYNPKGFIKDSTLNPFQRARNRNKRNARYYTELIESIFPEKNTILYESAQGEAMTGIPLAIFNKLLHLTEFDHLNHVWVLNTPSSCPLDIKQRKNVQLVKKHSKSYLKYLCASKFLVDDGALPAYFTRQENQLYINTDHIADFNVSTTQTKNNSLHYKKTQHNLLQTTHILSLNASTAGQLLSSYNIDGIYSGTVITIENDSGQHSTEEIATRVINSIFHNCSDFSLKKNNNKLNLLMYCGSFTNNGITISGINLFNNIDYNKYNLILIKDNDQQPEAEINLKKLNSKVKVIYRNGPFDTNKKQAKVLKSYFQTGKTTPKSEIILEKYFLHQASHLLGELTIDIAVDFSGYVKFWTLFIRYSHAQRKIIYQHNDMIAENNKIINGRFKHRQNFKVIFDAYQHFDKIVSVSKMTRDTNLSGLKKYIPNCSHKFCYVTNSIDYKGIVEKSLEKNVPTGTAKTNAYPEPEKNNINFIHIGRYSPEKCHDKLLLAFKRLSLKNSKYRLYLVGDGTLFNDIKKQVNELHLSDKVVMTGQVDNPYPLLAKCDCLVLASDHEGQPMVLLEALVLGKPIISTNIAGARSLLVDTYGTMVSNDVNGLYEGMLDFPNTNKNKLQKFDYISYQKTSIWLFYTEVCGLPN